MERSQSTTKRRFSSLLALALRARQTFERFPLVLLSAIAAAVVAHHLAGIEFEDDLGAKAYYPILMVCILGIALFLSLRLLGESRGWSRETQAKVALAGLAALVSYYAVLPLSLKGADVFRYFQLIVGLHLLVAFGPFVGRSTRQNGFWQYNRVLFLRIAQAAFYAAVLYIGLSLAILACETLLDFDFESMIYMQLWFWIIFAYGTWFFLAGIPGNIRALEDVQDYPTELRIFTQYVLIPLVVVYLIILLAYTAKILIEWNLPEGWVGYPVIGVAITGMLALLLVFPIRERAENAWIVTYARYFYWALFPLIALITVAIATRIDAYGITERRYAVVIATAWLLGIALYFTFGRRKDIRIIPVTLCIGTFLTAVGPWSATSVSRSSQLHRLRDRLIQGEVLVDGALNSDPKAIDFETGKEISNIVRYVDEVHGLNRIRDWYAEPERLPEDMSVQLAVEEMGLRYIGPRQESPTDFSIDVAVPEPLQVSDFDYVYYLNEHWGEGPSQLTVTLDSTTELSLEGTTLTLGQPAATADLLALDLGPLLVELREKAASGESHDADAPMLEAQDARYRMRVYLSRAVGSGEADALSISDLEAVVLIAISASDS